MKEDMRRTAGPEILARSHGIRVEIPQNCMNMMQGWCNAAKTEVSGYGIARLIDGVFRVYKVFLPEQQCSTGFTLIPSESKARLDAYLNAEYTKKLQDGIVKGDMSVMDLVPPSAELGLWWHTHYDFNTFWSGTDDNQAQYLAEQRRNGAGWSLSLVINQAGDRLCRADFVSPVPIMIDELNIAITPNEGRASKRDYDRDIRRWVGPLVYEKPKIVRPTWANTPIRNKESIPMGTKYIIYGGTIMSLAQYACAVECFCGDGTCDDCKETMRAMQ